MTHEEHQKKHRRGSSPSRNDETRFTYNAGHLPSEEWKHLKWYPFAFAATKGIESRNTVPDKNAKG